MWSGPRNISTAMMYSFAQRKDTQVYDEPLYAHYLKHTDADTYHPGAEEVLQEQENDGEKVVRERILGNPSDKPVLFFKQMAHHLTHLDTGFLDQTINFILTRHPKEVLLSYRKQVDKPTAKDLGYEKQVEIRNLLMKSAQPILVVDSKQVLLNPEKELRRICDFSDIPFDDTMLKWEPGPIPEDGIWAKYWYSNVHRSDGFKPYKPKEGELSDSEQGVLEECLPLYRELVQNQ